MVSLAVCILALGIRLPPAADLDGHLHHLLSEAAGRPVALVFIAHDCPISLSYAPKMNRLAKEYAPKGIAFYIVYAEPDLKLTAARSHDKAYGYVCPALLDSKLVLTQRTGAVVTPEAIVLSPSGTALYRGRIDNLFAGYGVRRAHFTTDDLKSALDSILAGKPVAHPTTMAVGCFIPRQ